MMDKCYDCGTTVELTYINPGVYWCKKCLKKNLKERGIPHTDRDILKLSRDIVDTWDFGTLIEFAVDVLESMYHDNISDYIQDYTDFYDE